MKLMFYMIEKISDDLRDAIVSLNGKSVEARTLFCSFTTDIISLVAFGTEANCLKKPETSEFLRNAKMASMSTTWSKISFATKFFLPELCQYIKVTTFHPSFSTFLRKLFNEVMSLRAKSGDARDDLIDALIALKMSESDKSCKIPGILDMET